jgi:hypothetical protein
VRVRGMKGATIGKTIFDGNVIPPKYFKRIQMVDNRERIKFMQARDDASILNIRQAANMQNQLRTAAPRCAALLIQNWHVRHRDRLIQAVHAIAADEIRGACFPRERARIQFAEYNRITILLRTRNVRL